MKIQTIPIIRIDKSSLPLRIPLPKGIIIYGADLLDHQAHFTYPLLSYNIHDPVRPIKDKRIALYCQTEQDHIKRHKFRSIEVDIILSYELDFRYSTEPPNVKNHKRKN